MAIGRDTDSEYLERFIGDPQIPVLVAEDIDQIADRLVTVSIAVSHMSEAAGDRATVAERVFLPGPESDKGTSPAARPSYESRDDRMSRETIA